MLICPPHCIGIPDEHHSVFCPGINLEFAALDSTKQQQDSLSPCTVLILERENASHHTAALCEMLGIELKSQYILSELDFVFTNEKYYLHMCTVICVMFVHANVCMCVMHHDAFASVILFTIYGLIDR